MFENIHSCNSKDLEDFFGLKLEMVKRRNIMRRKENEKDVKKRYKMKIRLSK